MAPRALVLGMLSLATLTLAACETVATYHGGATTDGARDAAIEVARRDAADGPTDSRDAGDAPVDADGQPDDAISDTPPTLTCGRPLSVVLSNAELSKVVWVDRHKRFYAVGTQGSGTSRRPIVASFDVCASPASMSVYTFPAVPVASYLLGEVIAYADRGDGMLCLGGALRLVGGSTVDDGWLGCLSLDGSGAITGPAWSQIAVLFDAQPPPRITAGDYLLLAAWRDRLGGDLSLGLFPLDGGKPILSPSVDTDVSVGGALRRGGALVVGYASNRASPVFAQVAITANCAGPCPTGTTVRSHPFIQLSAYTYDDVSKMSVWATNVPPQLVIDKQGFTSAPLTSLKLVNDILIYNGNIYAVGTNLSDKPVLVRTTQAQAVLSAPRSTTSGTLSGIDVLPGGRLVLVGQLGSDAAVEVCHIAGCVAKIAP